MFVDDFVGVSGTPEALLKRSTKALLNIITYLYNTTGILINVQYES